jgi:hypothetical protein
LRLRLAELPLRDSGGHSLASLVTTISAMRVLLFAAAVLVAAVLLDSTLYDSRYLNAAGRMIAETFARLLGG